ncbi:MAG: ATP synthase F1 subunit delta [Chitinophagales bacterium]|nr:ATP synthase F1 subunit delta [Chitinophagales bacterium]
MLSPRLASRYAKSILSLAKERGSLEETVKDVRLLEETLDGSKELRLMLKSPIIPSDKKEKVMNMLFSTQLSDLTYKFINLLVLKGREKHLVEMVHSFMELYNKANHIVKATLTTAIPVDKKTVEEVRSLLLTNKLTESVEIQTKVDPTIVGGFVLKYGDMLLDNSVERKLQLIKKQIQDKSYISKF